jgi:hypothetical protein
MYICIYIHLIKGKDILPTSIDSSVDDVGVSNSEVEDEWLEVSAYAIYILCTYIYIPIKAFCADGSKGSKIILWYIYMFICIYTG